MEERYQGFWPLPGGLLNFVQTLNKVLAYVRDTKPTEDQLVQWFFQNFPKVLEEGPARDYARVTLRHSGLVEADRNGHFLTDEGKRYLANPNNPLLFEILDDHVIGFKEALEIVGSGDLEIEEFAREISKRTQMNWRAPYGQPYWRVSWLRAMGFVNFEAGKFRLSEEGKSFLNSVTQKNQARPPVVAPRQELQPPEKLKPQVQPDSGQIMSRLRDTQHLPREYEKFEGAIAEAFRFLGLATEHLGRPGETDVFASAHIKADSYSAVIDGKTTEGERVTERQISWPSLRDHQRKQKAQFAVVVGPSFAGGDMTERAKEFGVTLIETETLARLVDLHSRTPLNLEDLRKVFEVKGLLRLEDCLDLMTTISRYERRQKLVPLVLQSLYKLQEEGDHTHTSDVRWQLKREFSQEEVQETLELLRELGFTKKLPEDQWVCMVNPEVASKKFRAIADMFADEKARPAR